MVGSWPALSVVVDGPVLGQGSRQMPEKSGEYSNVCEETASSVGMNASVLVVVIVVRNVLLPLTTTLVCVMGWYSVVEKIEFKNLNCTS